ALSGQTFYVNEGDIPWIADYEMMIGRKNEQMSSFKLDFASNACTITFTTKTKDFQIKVGMNGNGILNSVNTELPYSEVFVSGWWENDSQLCIDFRWVETCIIKHVVLDFTDKEASIKTASARISAFDPKPVHAKAFW